MDKKFVFINELIDLKDKYLISAPKIYKYITEIIHDINYDFFIGEFRDELREVNKDELS